MMMRNAVRLLSCSNDHESVSLNIVTLRTLLSDMYAVSDTLVNMAAAHGLIDYECLSCRGRAERIYRVNQYGDSSPDLGRIVHTDNCRVQKIRAELNTLLSSVE